MTPPTILSVAGRFAPDLQALVLDLLSILEGLTVAAEWDVDPMDPREAWLVADHGLVRVWATPGAPRRAARAELVTTPWSLVRNPVLTMEATKVRDGWAVSAQIDLEYPELKTGTITNRHLVKHLARFGRELSRRAHGR